MSISVFEKLKRRQPFIALILLLGILISLPYIHYYLLNFYKSGWQQYKAWYPHLYFIIYPLVKITPYVTAALILWLLRKTIADFFYPPFRIMKRYLLNVMLAGIAIATMLSLSEFALRASGYKPGFRMNYQYFTPVDSLYELSGFYADSNGILCISQEARQFISAELHTKNNAKELTPLDATQSAEVFHLPLHFMKLRENNYHSPFKSFLETLDAPADAADKEFFNAIKDYTLSPINASGFKSIEFKRYNGKRKSILLLGDSFTWGHSAKNITDCFADLLLTKGYVVYNTGITGVDPAQYLQITKVLVPLLKPDYIVVNFYMGNDIKYFKREPLPYVPVFYCTNAGNLISCPDGIYFMSAKEAYDYSLSNFIIPKGIPFNDFCSRFVLTTLLWKTLVSYGMVDGSIPQFKEYFAQAYRLKTKTPYSDLELREIKKITEAHNGKFLLVVIPSFENGKFHYPQDVPTLFLGIDYFVPPIEKKHYHQKTDGHYNSSGHAMHADFIDSLVKSYPLQAANHE